VILERHLGLADDQLARIFPNLPAAGSNFGDMLVV